MSTPTEVPPAEEETAEGETNEVTSAVSQSQLEPENHKIPFVFETKHSTMMKR